MKTLSASRCNTLNSDCKYYTYYIKIVVLGSFLSYENC